MNSNKIIKHALRPISNLILDEVASTINQYDLLEKTQDVIVAFSGGKDSLFTSLCLRELGYSVIPAIVDMGYEKDWGEKILFLANQIGFDNAEVLYARQKSTLCNINHESLKKVNSNIDILNNSEIFKDKKLTPCTYCYNTKVVLLEDFAIKNNIDRIVFGQHIIDAIASMMKLALMYIDRWDNGNTVYNHGRFSDLVDSLLPLFLQYQNEPDKIDILSRIGCLCDEKKAATDDPPRQMLNSVFGKINLVRPLFRIRESSIIKYISENNLYPEASGCGHGSTKETQTPREMIHYRILKEIDNSSGTLPLISVLENLVDKGLTTKGELIINVRNARAEILGRQYKNLGISCNKKE